MSATPAHLIWECEGVPDAPSPSLPAEGNAKASRGPRRRGPHGQVRRPAGAAGEGLRRRKKVTHCGGTQLVPVALPLRRWASLEGGGSNCSRKTPSTIPLTSIPQGAREELQFQCRVGGGDARAAVATSPPNLHQRERQISLELWAKLGNYEIFQGTKKHRAGELFRGLGLL